jgi:hypothetical protein
MPPDFFVIPKIDPRAVVKRKRLYLSGVSTNGVLVILLNGWYLTVGYKNVFHPATIMLIQHTHTQTHTHTSIILRTVYKRWGGQTSSLPSPRSGIQLADVQPHLILLVLYFHLPLFASWKWIEKRAMLLDDLRAPRPHSPYFGILETYEKNITTIDCKGRGSRGQRQDVFFLSLYTISLACINECYCFRPSRRRCDLSEASRGRPIPATPLISEDE